MLDELQFASTMSILHQAKSRSPTSDGCAWLVRGHCTVVTRVYGRMQPLSPSCSDGFCISPSIPASTGSVAAHGRRNRSTRAKLSRGATSALSMQPFRWHEDSHTATAHVQTQALHLQLHRRVAHQSAHASSTPTPGAAHLNFMNQLLFCRLGVHPAITVAVLELGLLKTEPCWAWFEIFMPGLVSRT